MNWKSQGASAFCSPYQIHRDMRGFSVWLSAKAKYGVLARELPSMEAAKAFAEKHRKDATPISGAEPAGVAS